MTDHYLAHPTATNDFFTSNHHLSLQSSSHSFSPSPSSSSMNHNHHFSLSPNMGTATSASVLGLDFGSHDLSNSTALLDDEDDDRDQSMSSGSQRSHSVASMGMDQKPLLPHPLPSSSSSKRQTTRKRRKVDMGELSTDEEDLDLDVVAGNGVGSAPGPAGVSGGKKKGAGAAGNGKGKKKAGGAASAAGSGTDKKKKAGRACAACQKAHLTCDDGRPCARCVKKGCPDQCHDGARKKAKYLLEVPDELLERRPHPPPAEVPASNHSEDLSTTVIDQPPNLDDPVLESPPIISSLLPPDPIINQPAFSFDSLPYYDPTTSYNPSSNEFGSEAANLEYAILSSMLNGHGFSSDAFLTGSSGSSGLDLGVGGSNNRNGMNGTGHGVDNSRVAASYLFDSSDVGGSSSSGALKTPNQGGGFDLQPSPTHHLQHLQHSALGGVSGAMSPPRLQDTASAGGGVDLFAAASAAAATTSNSSADAFAAETAFQEGSKLVDASNNVTSGSGTTGILTAEEAYRNVTKPYPYAQSYHYLVRHLKERFEKNDILRIIRALATFRPSLIALQMPLTEEDETFVERTFQRTLVELNKLISFSGTPTVVWRRTGEICLVGAEFSYLTGWSREELVGKKYIFELFDAASVVEYYEAFAQHAFESTSSSVSSQCVILGPSGKPVPCAFCFSVRRDLFSCPFLVIGSFLPVLV